MLQLKTPDAYELLTKYVYSVIRSTASGVFLTNRPAWITIGRNSVDVPVEILASGLAHEAYHCKLYCEYKDPHPGERVPGEVASGREAGLKCIAYDLDALRRLGASEEMVRSEIRSSEEAIQREFWKTRWEHRTW